MAHRLSFIIYIISAFLFSCGTDTKESENVTPERRKAINNALKELKQDSILTTQLIKRHKANSDWDKLQYTYQIQEKLESSDSTKFAINAQAIDIVKIRGTYFTKIIQKSTSRGEYTSPYKEVLLLLSISNPQLLDISSRIPPEEEWSFTSENGCYIFTADSVINNNIKYYDELTSESNTAIVSTKGVLVIKGKLIDYYIFKQLK